MLIRRTSGPSIIPYSLLARIAELDALRPLQFKHHSPIPISTSACFPIKVSSTYCPSNPSNRLFRLYNEQVGSEAQRLIRTVRQVEHVYIVRGIPHYGSYQSPDFVVVYTGGYCTLFRFDTFVNCVTTQTWTLPQPTDRREYASSRSNAFSASSCGIPTVERLPAKLRGLAGGPRLRMRHDIYHVTGHF